MDKIRAHREELKRLWFSIDYSNTSVRKEIIVKMGKSKFWPGYGDVEIRREGPDGFSTFKTHQEHPLEYAKDRMNEEQYKDYKLIVK